MASLTTKDREKNVEEAKTPCYVSWGCSENLASIKSFHEKKYYIYQDVYNMSSCSRMNTGVLQGCRTLPCQIYGLSSNEDF